MTCHKDPFWEKTGARSNTCSETDSSSIFCLHTHIIEEKQNKIEEMKDGNLN